jgi:mono/diheme cytochrome c family protein
MLNHKFLWVTVIGIALFGIGCRYDMQDQPRYRAHRQSDFFADGKAMRELPEGTVARGKLREDKEFYTGKKQNAGGAAATAPASTMTDGSGNTLVTSFPDAIEEFPVPITKELVDRGEERYRVFCIVCHGPVGNGDGMIVRRGFPQPPTYNDDRLRNAPVGHFYDVITNGWGKMNSYASQVPPADRWAIVAYIRTLQISQNPNGNLAMPSSRGANTTNTNTTNTNTTELPRPVGLPNSPTQGGTR